MDTDDVNESEQATTIILPAAATRRRRTRSQSPTSRKRRHIETNNSQNDSFSNNDTAAVDASSRSNSRFDTSVSEHSGMDDDNDDDDEGNSVTNDENDTQSSGSRNSSQRGRRAPRSRRGRPASSTSTTTQSNSKKKDGDLGKGLRHFSLKVCQKVEKKGCTNYAEVADELVSEFKATSAKRGIDVSLVDQKNIRRRVYDALNVLRAMGVISKNKKEIAWVGLPSATPPPGPLRDQGYENAREGAARAIGRRARRAGGGTRTSSSTAAATQRRKQTYASAAATAARAHATREALLQRVADKRKQHDELLAQQIWYRNLLSRNLREADQLLAPTVERLSLPFVIINTRSTTTIKCQVSPDQTEYFFNFSEPFEIHDDNEILKRMHHRLVLVSENTPDVPHSTANTSTTSTSKKGKRGRPTKVKSELKMFGDDEDDDEPDPNTHASTRKSQSDALLGNETKSLATAANNDDDISEDMPLHEQMEEQDELGAPPPSLVSQPTVPKIENDDVSEEQPNENEEAGTRRRLMI